jgi:hypothetical protein
LQARASALDDLETEKKKADVADDISNAMAGMSIDDEAYDDFDTKSMMSKFTSATARTAARANKLLNDHSKPSGTIQLPYRINIWRDKNLRKRCSIIIHLLSGQESLMENLRYGVLASDRSVFVIRIYYHDFMLDQYVCIYDPILSRPAYKDDAIQKRMVATALETHARTIAFCKDIAAITGGDPHGSEPLIYVEEMRINLGFKADPVFVLKDEDKHFYGKQIHQAEDGAKFLRIELKGEAKVKDTLSSPGRSDLLFSPSPEVQHRGGGLPDEISFNTPAKGSQANQDVEMNFDDDRDTVDEWARNFDEERSTSSRSTKSLLTRDYVASGSAKKKLKLSSIKTNLPPTSPISVKSTKSQSMRSPTSVKSTKSQSMTSPTSVKSTKSQSMKSHTSVKSTKSQSMRSFVTSLACQPPAVSPHEQSAQSTGNLSRKRRGGALQSLRKAAEDGCKV